MKNLSRFIWYLQGKVSNDNNCNLAQAILR
jgi:hypothetical protein